MEPSPLCISYPRLDLLDSLETELPYIIAFDFALSLGYQVFVLAMATMNSTVEGKRPVPPIPDGKDASAPYHDTRALANPAPIDPQPHQPAMTTARTGGHSPSSSIDADAHLPTILFAIPFPPATKSSSNKDPVSPYLIYALPRAPYHKPAEDANGKKMEKEGLVKKVERKWQEEIAEGEKIRKGQDPDAGNWKKFKGKAVGVSDPRAFIVVECVAD